MDKLRVLHRIEDDLDQVRTMIHREGSIRAAQEASMHASIRNVKDTLDSLYPTAYTNVPPDYNSLSPRSIHSVSPARAVTVVHTPATTVYTPAATTYLAPSYVAAPAPAVVYPTSTLVLPTPTVVYTSDHLAEELSSKMAGLQAEIEHLKFVRRNQLDDEASVLQHRLSMVALEVDRIRADQARRRMEEIAEAERQTVIRANLRSLEDAESQVRQLKAMWRMRL